MFCVLVRGMERGTHFETYRRSGKSKPMLINSIDAVGATTLIISARRLNAYATARPLHPGEVAQLRRRYAVVLNLRFSRVKD